VSHRGRTSPGAAHCRAPTILDGTACTSYTTSMARARGSKSTKGGRAEVKLYKLHPGQQKIVASDSRYTVVMCGRRFGKTITGIDRIMKSALAGYPTAWFAPTYKYTIEVWRDLTRRLGPAAERISEQDRRIDLVTGGSVDIWTMDSADPGRGRKYKDVVIDEAGVVRDLVHIWQMAIRPTLTDYRGRALILGTPKGRRHGFVTMFRRGEDPEEKSWSSIRAPTTENPHIPKDEIEAARRELPHDVFMQEYEGIPMDDGANPFGVKKIEESFFPVSEINDSTDGQIAIYGVDLARAQDFTVVCGMDKWKRVIFLERWQAPWSVTKPRILETIKDVPSVVDATGVGDAIVSDLQMEGAPITGFVFTQPSKLRLMQRLIAAFQSNELMLPEEELWLRNELESFEFNYTANGVRYEAPRGEHDDGVMALALALHGWDRVQGVLPEEVIPIVHTADDPYIVYGKNATPANSMTAGDYQEQLPLGGW